MSDIIYYNISIANNTRDKIILRYEDTRSGVILEDPSKYQVAVARFNVPGIDIPITLFDDTEDLYVRLTWDNCGVNEPVKFIVRKTVDARKTTYENAVYSISQYLDMVNEAYSIAIAKLALVCPTFPPVDEQGDPIIVLPPVFQFDPTTRLISFYVDAEYYDISVRQELPYVGVLMNLALYSKFSTFDSFAVRNELVVKDPVEDSYYDKFQQLIIRAPFEGSPIEGFIKVTQEYDSLSLLNDAHTIVFESAALPLSTEYIPATVQNRNSSRAIITDFLMPPVSNDRSDIQFAGTGLELRWIDLVSDIPLRSIDLTGYWQDKAGNLFALTIPEYDLFTCKLAFRIKPHYAEKRDKHVINYSIHQQHNQEEEEDQKNDIK